MNLNQRIKKISIQVMLTPYTILILIMGGNRQAVVCETFTFTGGKGGGSVIYPVLNSTVRTHVSFEFRGTGSGEELLLYADDNRNGGKRRGHSMFVLVHGGQLHVILTIHGGPNMKQDETKLGHNLNDSVKHYVRINRVGTSFEIMLDGEVKTLTGLDVPLKFNSHIYVGGPPLKMKNRIFRSGDFMYSQR